MATSTPNGAITVGAFVRLLAHELGNPVATIRMSAEMLAGGSSEELQQQLFEIILSESGRLESLIESAVYYTALPAVEPLEIELDSMIQAIIHQLEPRIPIDMRNDSGVEAIQADTAQLSRMLREVLGNALEAGPTVVKLSVRSEGDIVVFSVRDDGEGIAEEKLATVFDPFYTTREGQLGLGLSIARRIAELHGGSITIGRAEPTGTVAEIRVPKLQTPRS